MFDPEVIEEKNMNGLCWKGPVGVICLVQEDPTALIKQDHLKQLIQDHLQRWRFLGQLEPVLGHPHSEVLPEVHRNLPVFQFVPIASGPVTLKSLLLSSLHSSFKYLYTLMIFLKILLIPG